MTRRAAVAAGLAAASLLLLPAPALAHGLGGRLDLPVPLWLFVYGAAAVVLISFVALGVLWKEPRLERTREGRALPGPMQRILTSGVVEVLVRAASVLVLAVVLGAGLAGQDNANENIAPWIVFVIVWVGLAFVHALLGNWWATISPWDSLARFLGLGDEPRRAYPLAWGYWPAALFLLVFVFLELVVPDGTTPRVTGWAALGYTVLTLAGMAVFGRDTWNRRGEAFAVYFGLLARLAPVSRHPDGRVVLRRPLADLPRIEPRPGLVALVMILIGSTTFDGLTGTTLWAEWTRGLDAFGVAWASATGLLATIVLAACVYALSMIAASAVAGIPWHPLSVRFAHSLVPIAFAYVAAHYFSLLLLEGQTAIALASDPLGQGWNLFGTADLEVNFELVSANAIWYFQVAVIVLGHVSGVLLAHDRALAAFPGPTAVRTQYALLGVMVLFTMSGLGILSGG